MKKMFFTTLLVIIAGYFTNAQCDKKVILIGSKTEILKADSTVQRTIDENTTIQFDKTNITISPESDKVMSGTITSAECNWQVPFKEGKTVLKVALSDNDKMRNLTITIVGKGGKISFLAEVDDNPNKKIRFATVDKFEENAG